MHAHILIAIGDLRILGAWHLRYYSGTHGQAKYEEIHQMFQKNSIGDSEVCVSCLDTSLGDKK